MELVASSTGHAGTGVPLSRPLTSAPHCSIDQRRFGEPDAAAASGFALPSTRQSLIVSFLGLGALFGSLLSGVLSGKFGIKVTYLFRCGQSRGLGRTKALTPRLFA